MCRTHTETAAKRRRGNFTNTSPWRHNFHVSRHLCTLVDPLQKWHGFLIENIPLKMYPTYVNSFHRWGGWGRRSHNWGTGGAGQLKALSDQRTFYCFPGFHKKKSSKSGVWSGRERLKGGMGLGESGGEGNAALGSTGREEEMGTLEGRKLLWSAFVIHKQIPAGILEFAE